jgi:uncharacterized protein
MILETVTAAGGAWALRALAHHAIVRGLRAPRLRHAPGPPEDGVAPGLAWSVRILGARGRHLFGWWVMPPGITGQPAPVVLVMHGWGANAALMWPVVAPLHAAGFGVLLIDARCHGNSDDETFSSMPRFAEDIAAGLAWLRLQPGIAPTRMAVLGHSVGAAAALLHAAGHDDVRAVVSLAAFAHPREVMRRFMAEKRVPFPVLGWYVLRHVEQVIGASFDAIAPLNTLPRVRCPVLLVHGRADTTVSFSDAERLSRVSSRARLLPVASDHDLRVALRVHAPELVAFLQSALGTVPVPRADEGTAGPA